MPNRFTGSDVPCRPVPLQITDDVALFATDTMRSATGEASADVNDLVSVLTRHSAGAIDWLVNAMGVDLALVSQLGGHSRPRTHRPVKAPAGFAIMSALMKLLEDYPPERLQIKTGTKMRSLIEADGSVKGIEVPPRRRPFVRTRACLKHRVSALFGFFSNPLFCGSNPIENGCCSFVQAGGRVHMGVKVLV